MTKNSESRKVVAVDLEKLVDLKTGRADPVVVKQVNALKADGWKVVVLSTFQRRTVWGILLSIGVDFDVIKKLIPSTAKSLDVLIEGNAIPINPPIR